MPTIKFVSKPESTPQPARVAGLAKVAEVPDPAELPDAPEPADEAGLPVNSLPAPGWASQLPWWIPLMAAAVCIIAYFCFVQTLVDLRGDKHWERLLWVFHSVEALGYAAIGTVLGVALQAPRVASAQAETQAATQQAERHRAKATSLERSVARIRQLHNLTQERAATDTNAQSIQARLDEAIRTAG